MIRTRVDAMIESMAIGNDEEDFVSEEEGRLGVQKTKIRLGFYYWCYLWECTQQIFECLASNTLSTDCIVNYNQFEQTFKDFNK